jgi:uncharacterized membrane protein YkvA (DUF1232 family)
VIRALLIGLGVAAGLWLALVLVLVVAGRRTQARELAVLLPNLIRLFHGLVRDPRVPRRTKWLLLLGLAWFASPVDLIPEFVPVLGPLDDAVVAALILRHILRVAGRDVVEDHWAGDPATLRRILSLVRA